MILLLRHDKVSEQPLCGPAVGWYAEMVGCTAVSERIPGALDHQFDSKLDGDTPVVSWCSKQASLVGINDGLGTVAEAKLVVDVGLGVGWRSP